MLPGFQLDLLLIYFVYGLAFFSMGLLMLMEAGRSPFLAEARTLRPLAAFGISHGLHEWLELFVLQAEHLGAALPSGLVFFRLALLVFSFLSLLAYGVQVLRPPQKLAALDAWVGMGVFIVYLAAVASLWQRELDFWLRIRMADALARYMIAVPGGLLAAGVLRRSMDIARDNRRVTLAHALRWSVIGMAGYAILQIFVPSSPFFPANTVNAGLISQTLHIPVQLLCAVMAVLVTIGLLRATQFAEVERQRQLNEAQQARLDAMQRVQDELVQRERMRQQLLQRIVVAQEDERARIARELHDETAQLLTAFSLNLAGLQNRLGENAAFTPLISRLKSLSRRMSVVLHRLVHDLRPAQLDDLGLWAALEYLAEVSREQFDLEVALHLDGQSYRLDPLVETVVFRIVQEALTNTTRHAHSHSAEVWLRVNENEAYLRIQDHGCGFDVQQAIQNAAGLGLVGMQERADAVNANLRVESAPGEGTLIEVTLPSPLKTRMQEFLP
ncbi:MAG: hypothetical protein Fur0018_13090 [Anaerolineales bacterium]